MGGIRGLCDRKAMSEVILNIVCIFDVCFVTRSIAAQE